LSPEEKEKRRAILRKVMSSPEEREKRSALLREAWLNMSPEEKEKRAATIREALSSPETKMKHSAGAREAWLNMSPETREQRLAPLRKIMSSPEFRDLLSASGRESWIKRPEDKAILAATMSALWKRSEKKDIFLKNKVFRRDDTNPKMKMGWDKMKREAKTFADKISAEELQVQYHNAFIHLHLDASQYDSKLGQTTIVRKSRLERKANITDAQLAKLKERFLENVLSTGLPEMSYQVFDKLAEELQCETHGRWLRRHLNKERQVWLRAAAVLRRKGVDVDYANIPHLTWLEEVGRP